MTSPSLHRRGPKGHVHGGGSRESARTLMRVTASAVINSRITIFVAMSN